VADELAADMALFLGHGATNNDTVPYAHEGDDAAVMS
jgi:hypothetical protein